MLVRTFILSILATSPGWSYPTLDGDSDLEEAMSPTRTLASSTTDTDNPLFNKNLPSSCNWTWPTMLVPLASAQVCHSYLAHDANPTDCSIPPPQPGPTQPAFGSSILCLMNLTTDTAVHEQAAVLGATFKATGSVSTCSDVARGMQWVLNHCVRDGQVAGQAPAWGNGDLLVVVQQGSYLNLTDER